MFFQGFVIEDSIKYPETIRTVVKVGGGGEKKTWGLEFSVGKDPTGTVCCLIQRLKPASLGVDRAANSSALGHSPAPSLVVPLCACSVPLFLPLAGSGRSHPSARSGGEREPSSSRRPQRPAGPHHLQPELPAGNRHQQHGPLWKPQLAIRPLSLRKGTCLCRPHSRG